MDVLAIAVGVVLVVWMLLDSFETLLATSLRSSRFSFTSWYYRCLWGVARPACARVRDDARRERWLSRFGPASFLGLLVVWTGIEIVGWGLIWWGVRGGFATPIDGLGDAWYYSGVVYFSIGFGDILPSSGFLRLLTVVEGLSGLGTLGLVIGYLPSLNAAYSARERQLLLLDDLTDARITPVSLVQSRVGPGGDLTDVNAMFEEWATWCADVYDSHTSFPVLVWFRSKHRGHSWVTGLGVVTDSAIAFAAAVPGLERGPALRLHRQATRLLEGLADRVGLEPKPVVDLSRRAWTFGYENLAASGLELRDFEESYATLQEMRSQFHPWMEAFIDELLAPRGFWGVTAADHLAEADIDSFLTAAAPADHQSDDGAGRTDDGSEP